MTDVDIIVEYYSKKGIEKQYLSYRCNFMLIRNNHIHFYKYKIYDDLIVVKEEAKRIKRINTITDILE